MEFVAILGVVLCALVVFEYRIRRPDQIVLAETRDGVRIRKARFYPRHFSTPIGRTTHAFAQTVDASAKGNLELRVKLAVTVTPSIENLPALLSAGGWTRDAVQRAAKELETLLLGHVKGFTELHGIEDLSSDRIQAHLHSHTPEYRSTLGVEVATLTVVSFEAVDARIAEAIRSQEQARILEQTELMNQQARVAAARARLKADEEISTHENTLEMKRFTLRKEQFEKDAALAAHRAEHELRLKRLQLEFDKEELRLLKENPELLLLTPQAARLAEASQALKNARTVVSLAPGEGGQAPELLGMFHALVQNALDAYAKGKKA